MKNRIEAENYEKFFDSFNVLSFFLLKFWHPKHCCKGFLAFYPNLQKDQLFLKLNFKDNIF